jgi:hypothetical protein
MTKLKTSADVVPGDRRFRRRMLILCSLLAVASAYAAYGVQANLQRQFSLSAHDPLAAMENMVHIIRCVSLSAAIIFVGFAAWFAWLGTGVLRHGQFPPPGVAVMSDTRIRRGWCAQLIGSGAILYCVFLFLMGTYGASRFEHAVSTFVKHDVAIKR